MIGCRNLGGRTSDHDDKAPNRNVGTTRDIIGMGQHLEETCWSVSIISSLYQDLEPKPNRNASNMFYPNPINLIENTKRPRQTFTKWNLPAGSPSFKSRPTLYLEGNPWFILKGLVMEQKYPY